MERTLHHVFKVWFADVNRFHDVFWQAHISVRPFWLVVDFDAAVWSWKPKWKHRRNVSLSGKSGQTTAPAWSENINQASCELFCVPVIVRGRHSIRFGAWVSICFLAAWLSPTVLHVASFELHVGIPLSLEELRPLGQQPNQARSNGSISFRQSIIWQRRKWKIRPIKIRFSIV